MRPPVLLGGALVALVALTAAISLVWTPHDYAAIDVSNRLHPPSAIHWLGTDQLGRDIVSLLMVGAQSSVLVAFLSVGLGALIGVGLGLIASAQGGWAEEGLMRLTDVAIAFPALLFAVMLAAIYGPSLEIAILAIAFVTMPVFARVARASANQVWSREYVQAATVAGRTKLGITFDHVLPNIAPILLVQATIEFAIAILAEAALSYLGLGVQPPTPSWGRMLAEAQTFLYFAPSLAIWPGLCIVIAVIGFNVLGDGLRDLADPRLRGRRP
ncbi:ABC transporter permease [Thalassococcus sp. S3]|uniref:ABC transporter permease n=1 Tax=Thalassococcus sp. S3 TaxID=2017482 RepID=UPI001024916C|nr:ABC transporter permease [Thalassococcus sp. S3]QBF32014.1 peptide ABC transporter permease [Thalassococcus sp. S3]